MEYPIGIEMSKDYLSYEVSKAAYKLVHDVMLVQPGENVVITGDTSTDKPCTGSSHECSLYCWSQSAACFRTDQFKSLFRTRRLRLEMQLLFQMSGLSYPYGSIFLSDAWKRAIDLGCRYINLTGMDATMIVNCIGRVDVNKVVELGEVLKAKLEAGNDIIIKDNKWNLFNSPK